MSKEVKRYIVVGEARCDEGFASLYPKADRYVLSSDYDALATQYAELLSANADLDRLASQTAALNEKAGMRVYELEQEVARYRLVFEQIMEQVDGNIRVTVRDCVNGQPDVQDIYDYCDLIEGYIDAALSQQPKTDERP